MTPDAKLKAPPAVKGMRRVDKKPKPVMQMRPTPWVVVKVSELRKRVASLLAKIGADAREGNPTFEKLNELEGIASRLESVARMYEPPELNGGPLWSTGRGDAPTLNPPMPAEGR